MRPARVSGIIVLACAGYFGYHIAYVRPRETLQQVEQQLEEARQEQELRQQVAQSLNVLDQQRQRFAPRLDPDWLLQEVGKLAREAGVEVASLSPQTTQQGGEFTQLAVTLQFESTYHQLGQFLSRIERAPQSIRVDDLDLTPERGNTGTAKIRLVLSTLYVPPLLTKGGTP